MFVTIINDCHDGNTMGRQATRISTLFGLNPSLVAINNYSELEAAGNIIDVLDASDGNNGVLLVNSAPRHKKKWPNGTPFGYFYFKKTLVVVTIDGLCLSLVKKFGLTSEICLTDVPTVVDFMIKEGHLDPHLRDTIAKSQFRSYDYMPRLAKWIEDGLDVPHEKYSIDEVEDAPKAVWWVDNFGNCKTTLLPEDVGFEPGKIIKAKFGDIKCFTQLRDVPVGEAALTTGSSGLGNKRFLEVVVQGKSAAEHFNLTVGSEII